MLVWLAMVGASRSGWASYEGFGADTPGGADGAVVRVTNLNDSGAGSLRAALAGSHRTIVFDVGGEIVLRDYLKIAGSFITIDGSTAPPPGITLKGRGLIMRGRDGAHDIIVRGLRIRSSAGDGIQIAYGAHRIVIDRVSVHASKDGAIDITEGAYDVTVAWSLLIEPFSGKTMLIKYAAGRVTLHHNFFLRGTGRNPSASVDDRATPDTDTTLDMRNNLVWDWGYGFGTQVHNGARANLVGNFYGSPGSVLQLDRDQAMIIDTATALVHTQGNASVDPLTVPLDALGNVAAPFPAAPVATEEACAAASRVLVGAGVRPLDALDESYVRQVVLPPCPSVTATLVAQPERVDFVATASGLRRGPRELTLLELGWSVLPWTAWTEGAPWLAVAPLAGHTRATLALGAGPGALDPGVHTGAIVFEAAAVNSPLRVPATLTLLAGPQTVPLPVTGAADDATQRGTSTARLDERLLKVGRDQLVGLRFAGVPLARGAQIASAVLRLYSPYAVSTVLKLRYYGEAADDAAPFTATAAALSRRPPTSRVVDDAPPPWPAQSHYVTPDLAAIVQEIVDRPGWAPGQALGLFIANRGSPGNRSIASYETAPIGTLGAVLEITVR